MQEDEFAGFGGPAQADSSRHQDAPPAVQERQLHPGVDTTAVLPHVSHVPQVLVRFCMS